MKEFDNVMDQTKNIQEAIEKQDYKAALTLIKESKDLWHALEAVVRNEHITYSSLNNKSYFRLENQRFQLQRWISYFLIQERNIPIASVARMIPSGEKTLTPPAIRTKIHKVKSELRRKANQEAYDLFKQEHGHKTTEELIALYNKPVDSASVENKYSLAYRRCMKNKAVSEEDRLLLRMMNDMRRTGMAYTDIGDECGLPHHMARTIIERTYPFIKSR